MRQVKSSRAIRWAGLGAMALAVLGTVSVAGAGGPRVSAAQRFEQAVDARQASVSAGDEPVKSATAVDGLVERNGTDQFQAQGSGGTFVPINPYRAFDSRPFADGFLFPGDEVYFDVITDVNGTPQIPQGATAVTYNLTATATLGAEGYLAVFPADINWPGNSSINWFGSNISIANGGVVALGNLDGPGQISVYCGGVPMTGTDFLIDITGYYI
jgi:hypothetical protein